MEIVLDIKNLIYTIRGIKVMLDSDLAKIYGYQTRSFNQQVKNNIEKFDEDFRFQLTKEEYEKILMSKNLTSNWGGTRKLPFAFTEQGVYMLMTVLKGELAIKQSKILIKAFKEMKDFIIENNNLIENRELLQIAIQTSQNTSDIAHIKNTMINKDDVLKIIKDFTDIHIKKEYLILNGETVEANLAYDSIYKTAKNKIYVIDTEIVSKNHCNGLTPRNPFAQYRVNQNIMERQYLTEDEINPATTQRSDWAIPKNQVTFYNLEADRIRQKVLESICLQKENKIKFLLSIDNSLCSRNLSS